MDYLTAIPTPCCPPASVTQQNTPGTLLLRIPSGSPSLFLAALPPKCLASLPRARRCGLARSRWPLYSPGNACCLRSQPTLRPFPPFRPSSPFTCFCLCLAEARGILKLSPVLAFDPRAARPSRSVLSSFLVHTHTIRGHTPILSVFSVAAWPRGPSRGFRVQSDLAAARVGGTTRYPDLMIAKNARPPYSGSPSNRCIGLYIRLAWVVFEV